jgi:hypothetical protein
VAEDARALNAEAARRMTARWLAGAAEHLASSEALHELARRAAHVLADADSRPYDAHSAAHALQALGLIGSQGIAALPPVSRERAKGAFGLLRQLSPLQLAPGGDDSFALMASEEALRLIVSSEITLADRSAAARVVIALWTACPPSAEHGRAMYRAMQQYDAARPCELRVLLAVIARRPLGAAGDVAS